MIRARFTHVVEDTVDFPDDFKVQTGDGMTQIKNPKTNEIIFQAPTSSLFLFRLPNQPQGEPQETPAPAPEAEPAPAEAGG